MPQNWPLGADSGGVKVKLKTYLSPFCPYTYHAEPRLFCGVPHGMEWPTSCATPPT